MCGPRQEVLTKLANLQKQQQEQAAKARLQHEELERQKQEALNDAGGEAHV